MLSGKKVYICSPLSAPDAKGVSHNMDMARFYMERMTVLYHCRTFASHAYLPLMLDDSIPEERETALRIGMELMDLCDKMSPNRRFDDLRAHQLTIHSHVREVLAYPIRNVLLPSNADFYFLYHEYAPQSFR